MSAVYRFLRFFILSMVVSLPSYAQPVTNALPTNSLGMFPTLPLSEVCQTWKVLGTWKLLMVYEVPAGAELARYRSNPMQYYVFHGDSRYGEYVSSLSAVDIKDVRTQALDRQGSVQQFTFNKDGVLFLYRDGIAIDSLACFIVAKTEKPFTVGQMLLMPPEHAAVYGRMVKVYQKVFP